MPGSHKANLPLPRSLSLMESHEHAVVEVAAKAGDVVIFTETATHGALAWTADHDRRVLAFKFSPANSAYAAGSHSVTYPNWVEEMTPAQKAVLLAPFMADGKDTNASHSSGREGSWQGQRTSRLDHKL